MRKIKIPYDEGAFELHIEERNLKAVITADGGSFRPEKTESEIIKEALEHPIV